MMIINNEQPRWFFYLEWVTLNVIAVVLAWYVALALISLIENVVGGTMQVGGQSRITEDFLFVYVLFPIIGLLTGILQYTLLRHYLPRMGWWIGATLLGWLLPFLLGFVFTTFFTPDNSAFSIMLGMFLIGATISLPQWWILHQRVRQAFWWVVTYGAGWWLVGSLSLVTSDPFPVLIAIALIPTIATSIACWLLLGRFPEFELEKERRGS
jgi:hypothetical protein